MSILKDHKIGEMVNELTEACKTHGHAQCLRGELSRIVNDYLKGNKGANAVHYLYQGITACGILPLSTGWHSSDKWTDDWADVTCPKCLRLKVNNND